MAKKLRDEDLNLNVIVNGNKAKKELGELETGTRNLKETNKSLRLEKSKLRKEDKNYKADLERINKAIKDNNAEIKKNENRMKQLRNQLGLTGLTYNQLTREANRLKILLKNTTPGTAEWKQYRGELDKVENQMKKVRVGASRSNLSLRKMADGFNRYFGIITAGIATITGVVFSIKQWIQGNVGLADSLADVMKTTGMTRKEVRELYTEFRYLNTRTPRAELLKLAEEAGRLGKKSKKDVMDFVEVANQIKVALGDDLGGDAEVAIREVGKLTEIFGIGEKYGVGFRESMLMVGSSINEVSANSQAQAPYLIDMMKRLAGVGTQAGISADQIIGYAAVLDEKGQRVEMASTAMGKTIISMFKDTDEYAKIAGMGVSDFTALLNKDANEAFIKVLEGLQGNNEGLSVMAGKLDALGVDGARAVQVLASLAGSTDKIRERQDLANKSLLQATSLTQEYNVKNENLAGNVERIGRAIRSWFINSELMGFLEETVSWMARIVETPVEEKFEKEREAANRLVVQLTDQNLEQAKRLELLNKLREISPDIVAGLNAENIEIKKLFENLEKYNEGIANKIVLSQLERDEQELLDKAGAVNYERRQREVDIRLKIKEVNEDILVNYESLEDMQKAAIEQLEKEGASVEEFTKKSDIWINRAGQRIDNRTKEQKQMDEILLISSRRNELLNEENELMGNVEQFQERAKIIKEMIDIQFGSGDNKENAGQGSDITDEDKSSGPSAITNALSPDIPTIEERYNKVKELMDLSMAEAKNKLLVSREEGKLSAEQYNLEMEALEIAHLEALIMAREEAGMETVNLENQLAEKKIAIAEAELKKREQMQKKQAEEEMASLQERAKKYQGLIQDSSQLIQQMVQGSMEGNKDMMRDALKNSVMMLLEYLKIQTQMAIAGATVQSLASPESIATFGVAGLAKAAVMVGLIEAAFAVVKGLVAGAFTSDQAYQGKYPVTGRQDGKTYNAGFLNNAGTGLLSSPTILAGEKPEIIIDPATTKNLQMNYPGVIQSIMAARVPQYASGSYPRELIRERTTTEKAVMDPKMMDAMNNFSRAVDRLQSKGIPAKIVRDYENARDLNDFMKDYDDTLNDVNL